MANGFSMAAQCCATAQTRLCLAEELILVQREHKRTHFPSLGVFDLFTLTADLKLKVMTKNFCKEKSTSVIFMSKFSF